MIETVLTCPLGHSCETVKDSRIHRCAWYIKLLGTNPQTGEQMDEQGCAMGWLPVLLVENARTTRSTAAAVESFRNEMVNANNQAANMLFFSPLRTPSQASAVQPPRITKEEPVWPRQISNIENS